MTFLADIPFCGRVPYDQTIMSQPCDGQFVHIRCVGAHNNRQIMLAPAIGFCQGSPMRTEIEALDPTGLQEATEAAADAIVESKFGNDAFETELSALAIETAQ